MSSDRTATLCPSSIAFLDGTEGCLGLAGEKINRKAKLRSERLLCDGALELRGFGEVGKTLLRKRGEREGGREVGFNNRPNAYQTRLVNPT